MIPQHDQRIQEVAKWSIIITYVTRDDFDFKRKFNSITNN